MRIILQPVLFQPDKDVVSSLEKAISDKFNPSSIITAPPIKEIPEQLLLFDDQRNQWKSNDILRWLSGHSNIYVPRETATSNRHSTSLCLKCWNDLVQPIPKDKIQILIF